MREWIALIPALPLAGFLALVVGRRLRDGVVAAIGVGSVAAAAALTALMLSEFLSHPPAGAAYTQTLWQWLRVDGFAPRVAFRVDALSLTMAMTVTAVGLLIHVYSVSHMAGGEGYGRFFAYMNLFVASMLVLVLADDLLLLYLGWEGVGLCSYLLIGFWYQDAANGAAARKAFLVTRVGDAAMAVALLILFTQLGTLDIQEAMRRATASWPAGSGAATAVALLLLAGAVGKSAQLPLQTWLPDAMAGPSPVSALIHAATMVTAGVYLIARTHGLFELAPRVQILVGGIGCATLLLAACSALVQRDLKRVLAYSTISQIGYMFLALGAGAYSAAMFHFCTHALFKSLLFLAAGVVVISLHEQRDMFQMGGLWRKLPVAFWTFLIGAIALAGLPPATSGFASKDAILYWVYKGPHGTAPCIAGIVGAGLTSLYTFRMVFLTFFGPLRHTPSRGAGAWMGVPLVLLAAGCGVAGLLDWPENLGGHAALSHFLASTFGGEATPESPGVARAIQVAATAASLAGLVLAYMFVLRRPAWAEKFLAAPAVQRVRQAWLSGWGFDALYDKLFVRPVLSVAHFLRDDPVDRVFQAAADACELGHRTLIRTQNGRVRWYAMGIAAGAIVILAILVLA